MNSAVATMEQQITQNKSKPFRLAVVYLSIVVMWCLSSSYAELAPVILSPPNRDVVLPDEPDASGNKNFVALMKETELFITFEDASGVGHYVRLELSSFLETKVRARVLELPDGFYYHYIVENALTSPQTVMAFILDVGAAVESAASTTENWVPKTLDPDVWRSHLMYWSASSGDSNLGIIAQGESKEFRVLSKNFPTIVNCWAKGKASGGAFTDTELPESLEIEVEMALGLLRDAVSGITVGPGDAPPDLNILQSYLRTSLERGWVCSLEAHPHLLALLVQANAAEEAHDLQKLVRHLLEMEQTVKQYASSNPPQLTTEVQALLGINAAWLRAQAEKELAEKSTPNQPAGDGSAP